MLRTLWTVAALAAALALPAATAAGTPGPPLTRHETTCSFDGGGRFVDVEMWLTAGMAAGDTFWLTGGGHYVIQSARSVVTDSSTVVPGEGEWSAAQTVGKKIGRSGTQIECRGYFDQGDGTYYWVDSVDYLIK